MQPGSMCQEEEYGGSQQIPLAAFCINDCLEDDDDNDVNGDDDEGFVYDNDEGMFLLARDLKGSNSCRIRGDGTRKTMHGRLDNYAPLDKNIH